MGVWDERCLVARGGYAGLENGNKGMQDSATPLANGTAEGQSLGKAVRGSVIEEERQRETTELCQTLWLKDRAITRPKRRILGAQAIGELPSGRSVPVSTNARIRWESATADYIKEN